MSKCWYQIHISKQLFLHCPDSSVSLHHYKFLSELTPTDTLKIKQNCPKLTTLKKKGFILSLNFVLLNKKTCYDLKVMLSKLNVCVEQHSAVKVLTLRQLGGVYIWNSGCWTRCWHKHSTAVCHYLKYCNRPC